jgi:hypothetical protein
MAFFELGPEGGWCLKFFELKSKLLC